MPIPSSDRWHRLPNPFDANRAGEATPARKAEVCLAVFGDGSQFQSAEGVKNERPKWLTAKCFIKHHWTLMIEYGFGAF